MGETLSKVAVWNNEDKKSLEYCKVNIFLFKKIYDFLIEISMEKPKFAKIIFKNPAIWETTAEITDEIKAKMKLSKEKTRGFYDQETGLFEAWTLDQLLKVVELSKENVIFELKNILGSNSDPKRILFQQKNKSFPLENAENNVEEPGTDGGVTFNDSGKIRNRKSRIMLYNLISDFDSKLLETSLDDLSLACKFIGETIKMVVDELCENTGFDKDLNILQEICFTDDYIYSNGCRIPPWRQTKEEIAIISVTPLDADKFYILATIDGFFKKQNLEGEEMGPKNERIHQILSQESEIFVKNMSFKTKQVSPTFLKSMKSKKLEELKKSIEVPKEVIRHDHKLKETLNYKTLLADEAIIEKEEKNLKDRHIKKTKHVEVETSSDSESDSTERKTDTHVDLPSDYWLIQKLIKYIKFGNKIATVLGLVLLRDMNLTLETSQMAIKDAGGLEILINLLHTSETKCKIGALQVIKEISTSSRIQKTIADLGGLEIMVELVMDRNSKLRQLSAHTIAIIARFGRGRKAVRRYGGIQKLVALLVLGCQATKNSEEKDFETAKSSALALCSLAESSTNRGLMNSCGVTPLLGQLLKSKNEDLLIPIVGILEKCAIEQSYRLKIRNEGMLEGLVRNLSSENVILNTHCANALFKCCEDDETRNLVRKYGGIKPLVGFLSQSGNKCLIAAATGAIWKCAINQENLQILTKLKATTQLVGLLSDQPDEVLVNVTGALSELAKSSECRSQIRSSNGIVLLINLLVGTNKELLSNATKAIGECAHDNENLMIIDKNDGVRLMWSLLKNPNPKVQASAAWAISPCVNNLKEAGELVRSFVGGIDLIVSLLKSPHIEVLANVCAAIANIAKDHENLAVLTDHGVVATLSALTNTKCIKLREHLAEAIAMCCNYEHNRREFGLRNTVPPLVSYLKTNNFKVQRSTVIALQKLSLDQENCIIMHSEGLVKLLVGLMKYDDRIMQEANAACIANIRLLALNNERDRLQKVYKHKNTIKC